MTATTIGPRRLREFGVAGYLPKPFALETLLEVASDSLGPDPAGARRTRQAAEPESDKGE